MGFVIILSSKTGITILVKSIILLLLGPPNLEGFFDSNSTFALNNTTSDTEPTSLCDYQNVPGVYNFESSTNFDNYLKALGVGFIMRQLASLAQPVVTLSVDCHQDTNADACNCSWTIFTDAGVSTHSVTFHLDTQINDTTLDGRKVTSVYSLTQPNVLTEFIIGRRVNSTVVRKFYPKG